MNHQSTAAIETWRAGHAMHASEFLARQTLQPALPLQALKSDAFEARQDVPIDSIRFCALQTEQEIRAISHLRRELNLPGSALAEPEFRALEKKETSTDWWALSPAMTH